MDDFTVSSESSTAYTCTEPASGFTWTTAEIRDFSFTVCNGAAIGFVEGAKGKVSIEIDYHLAKSSATYSHQVSGEVFTTVT